MAAGVVVGALLVAGCTDSAESVTPPSSSDEPSNTPIVDAQALLDESLKTMFQLDSIGLSSDTVGFINGEPTSTKTTGAWTRRPLAWKTSSFVDRPKQPIDTLPDGTPANGTLLGADTWTDVVYVQETPEMVYYRFTFEGLKPSAWVSAPGFGVRPGVSRQDLTAPPAIRLLTRITPTAITASGQNTVIAGNVPTRWALDELSLTDQVADLGFTERLSQSTTRVLVTIGDEGFPVRLEFSGAGIAVAGLDLPAYLLADFATARSVTTYGEANLKEPIEKPTTGPTPSS